MTGSLIVHVFKNSQKPFCELLEAHNIDFVERFPTPGKIMASGAVLEILYGVAAVAGSLGSIAAVLIAWIKSKSSRKVIISTSKNEVVHVIEGMSAKDVERVLGAARQISILDSGATQPDGQ